MKVRRACARLTCIALRPRQTSSGRRSGRQPCIVRRSAPRVPQGGPYSAELPSRFAPVSASAAVPNGVSSTPFKVFRPAPLQRLLFCWGAGAPQSCCGLIVQASDRFEEVCKGEAGRLPYRAVPLTWRSRRCRAPQPSRRTHLAPGASRPQVFKAGPGRSVLATRLAGTPADAAAVAAVR